MGRLKSKSSGEPNLIVIAGHLRSGTNLIARLLDGHDQVLSLAGEINFFTKLETRRKLKDVEQHFFYLFGRPFNHEADSRQPLGAKIDRHKNWQPNTLWLSIKEASPDLAQDEESLKKVIASGNDRDIFLAMADIYKKYYWNQVNEPKYILEKGHDNEFYLDKIFTLFPQAKIIHIIRDPFDVIESSMIDKKGREDRLMGYINTWKKFFRSGARASKKYPDNYCFLKYENLVEKTDFTMKKIAEFLDIEFNSHLLALTDNSGNKPWQPHTTQKVSVAAGKVEKRLLKKDASKNLGQDFMKIIGLFVGPEYKTLKWHKYDKYIDSGFLKIIFKKYPEKNFKNVIKNLAKYLISLKNYYLGRVKYL